MKWLGRILAGGLVCFIVPLFVAAACNLALTRTMINPETYRNAFDSQDIFNDLLPVTLPAIINAAGSQDGADVTDDVLSSVSLAAIGERIARADRAAWQEITNLLIPPTWIENQFNQTIDILFGVIAGDFSVLETPIDLTEVRNRLTGETALEAAQLLLAAAPACTRTEADVIRTIASGGVEPLPICQPADEALFATSYNVFVAWLNAIGEQLPAENITFADFWQISRDNARVVHLFVELDLQFTSLTYLCPLGLLSLMIFFAVRSLKGLGWWAGVVAMLSGVGILFMLLLLRVMFVGMFDLSAPISEIDAFLRQIFSGMLLSVLAQSSSLLLGQAAIFIGVGFVLLAMAWVIRAPHRAAERVLITEDGQIISTASRQRTQTLRLDDDGEF